MQKTKTRTNHGFAHGFKPEVKENIAPEIISTYEKNGIRMYVCKGNRTFIADTYDRMFIPKKGIILPKGDKGINPNRQSAALR
jgi:hypothetical protein